MLQGLSSFFSLHSCPDSSQFTMFVVMVNCLVYGPCFTQMLGIKDQKECCKSVDFSCIVLEGYNSSYVLLKKKKKKFEVFVMQCCL